MSTRCFVENIFKSKRSPFRDRRRPGYFPVSNTPCKVEDISDLRTRPNFHKSPSPDSGGTRSPSTESNSLFIIALEESSRTTRSVVPQATNSLKPNPEGAGSHFQAFEWMNEA